MTAVAVLLSAIVVLLILVLKQLQQISVKIAKDPYPHYDDDDKSKTCPNPRALADNLENLRNDIFELQEIIRGIQRSLSEKT